MMAQAIITFHCSGEAVRKTRRVKRREREDEYGTVACQKFQIDNRRLIKRDAECAMLIFPAWFLFCPRESPISFFHFRLSSGLLVLISSSLPFHACRWSPIYRHQHSLQASWLMAPCFPHLLAVLVLMLVLALVLKLRLSRVCSFGKSRRPWRKRDMSESNVVRTIHRPATGDTYRTVR